MIARYTTFKADFSVGKTLRWRVAFRIGGTEIRMEDVATLVLTSIGSASDMQPPAPPELEELQACTPATRSPEASVREATINEE